MLTADVMALVRWGRLVHLIVVVEEVLEDELVVDEADERAQREIASSTTAAMALVTSRVGAEEIENRDELTL